VFQVLEPLEVGASYTTAVNEKVGSANDSSSDEDLLSSECGWAVSTFEDSLDLDLLGVHLV
jgi:hypothetical protein